MSAEPCYSFVLIAKRPQLVILDSNYEVFGRKIIWPAKYDSILKANNNSKISPDFFLFIYYVFSDAKNRIKYKGLFISR